MSHQCRLCGTYYYKCEKCQRSFVNKDEVVCRDEIVYTGNMKPSPVLTAVLGEVAYQPEYNTVKAHFHLACECPDKYKDKGKETKKDNPFRIPEQFEKLLRVSDFDATRISDKAKAYIKEYEKHSILNNYVITGKSFIGKTFELSWIVWSMGRNDYYFGTPKEFVDAIQQKKITREALKTVPILIIDDIDKTSTQFENDLMFDVLDIRYKSGKKHMASSNSEKDILLEKIGEPLVNRLFDDAVEVIK